ncbi:hypothetical protein N657DRAFT_672787 [Parathielavia appendiculata]|uniref:Uncharacterized protein n=1 Tax=Parathielavia appendiculata TaxID=2587402 RepID=A0AAN6Z1S1_9PEZI|nr:hypothetical protein N657DRAFT_672787 [Parathielavia appendiculata]
MEMKNFGVVSKQMSNIMPAGVASVQQARNLAANLKIRFLRDAKQLLKQSAEYARQFRTRHVALCNFKVAIYFDFAQLPEVLADNEGVTVNEEGGSVGDFVLMYPHKDPNIFHYALLAFFKMR